MTQLFLKRLLPAHGKLHLESIYIYYVVIWQLTNIYHEWFREPSNKVLALMRDIRNIRYKVQILHPPAIGYNVKSQPFFSLLKRHELCLNDILHPLVQELCVQYLRVVGGIPDPVLTDVYIVVKPPNAKAQNFHRDFLEESGWYIACAIEYLEAYGTLTWILPGTHTKECLNKAGPSATAETWPPEAVQIQSHVGLFDESVLHSACANPSPQNLGETRMIIS
jgi:hypothetical protein